MQNTEDNSQSPSGGKRRTKQQSAAHRRAKTLKQVQDQAKAKGGAPPKRAAEVEQSKEHPRTRSAAKTLRQQAYGTGVDPAKARPAPEHAQDVHGPPSIPAEAKVQTPKQGDMADDRQRPSPQRSPAGASNSAGANMGFGKTMIMSSPVQAPQADNSPVQQAAEIPAKGPAPKTAKTLMMSSPVQTSQAENSPAQRAAETPAKGPAPKTAKTLMMSSDRTPRTDNTSGQKAARISARGPEARTAKTLMMSSPIQAPNPDENPRQQPKTTTKPGAQEQIAKTLMMSSPIQAPNLDESHDQPAQEKLTGKKETEQSPSPPSSPAQAAEDSAMDDTIPPDAPAPVQVEADPPVKKTMKPSVTDPKTELNTEPATYDDLDPTSGTPKNIWAMTTVALGFLLALSLAANGYLWFALSKAEQEQPNAPGKTGDNSVKTAAAVTAITGSAADAVKQAKTKKKPAAVAHSQKKKVQPKPAEGSNNTGANPKVESPKAESPKAASKEAEPKAKASGIKEGFGKLVVKARKGKAGSIRVSVNTVFKGHAPLELELEPGKYDLNFSRKGERSFKRIVIEAGETVEVTAKVRKR